MKKIPAIEEMKALREKHGLSRARLAEMIGVTRRSVENWEYGYRRPRGVIVEFLSEKLAKLDKKLSRQ